MVAEPLATGPAAPDEAVPSTLEPAGRRPGWYVDAIVVASLLALFFALHNITSLLRAPYWLDEAWVALSVRFPLSDLPAVTASTPLGFSFLLRLLPHDDLRILPLIFHLIGVAAAYALGRQLAPTGAGSATAMSRLAGIGCAMAVLLLPVQQVRHDLKQYSADAAVTLVLLGLASWVERGWSRRRLGVVVGVTAVATLVSSVTAIAAACAFGGLLIAAVARREWRRAMETAVPGAVAGVIVLAAILGTAERGRTQALKDYWASYFPSVTELPGYLGARFTELSPLMGLATVVVAVFFVLGVVTVARWGRRATAAAIVLLPVVTVVLGLARVYPLLDVRTSHYLIVAVGAVAGLGLVGAASWLAGQATLRVARQPRDRPRIRVAGAAIITVIGLATFAGHNEHWYRFDGAGYPTPQAMEDTRTAADYVAAHRGPHDVVVVSQLARYGFAFYSDQEPVELIEPYPTAIAWIVDFPAGTGILTIDGRTAADIRPILAAAVTLAEQRGPATRIWLVRSHLVAEEQAAWREALAGYQLDPVTDGVEPVYVLTARG